MTPDFIGFLTERLNEDEAEARSILDSLPPEWGPYTWKWQAWSSHPDDIQPYLFPHVPTPTRLLAEVEAKRQLLNLHGGVHECVGYLYGEVRTVYVAEGYVHSNCPTLQAVASVYQDHPEYQPEWSQP